MDRNGYGNKLISTLCREEDSLTAAQPVNNSVCIQVETLPA